jgi:hypothetical protein
VYLSVYLPPEWDYLGSTGPWTEELVWVERDTGFEPVARFMDVWASAGQNPSAAEPFNLIGWVRQGLPTQGKLEESFPTDGHHYLFSTLRPLAPPEGSLRIVAVHGSWFAAGVFAVIVLAGIVLMFTRAAVRLIAAGAFVVLVVLAGVFTPTFAMQIANGVTAAAVFVVLVLWAVWYAVWTRPRDPRVIARRKAREAARQASARMAAAAPPPAAPTPPAKSPPASGSEGGKDHA